jgi:ATP-dependent RNA helicase RhlE
MLFEELSLSKSIQKPFTNKAITSYTNTRKSIPLVLAGNDLIGCAQTGRKTAAFAIPIIHQLHRIVGSSKKAKVICFSCNPTRELAVQIGQSFDTYAKYTNFN